MNKRSKYILLLFLFVFLGGSFLVYKKLNEIDDHAEVNKADDAEDTKMDEIINNDSIMVSEDQEEEIGEYQLQTLPENPYSTIDAHSRKVPAFAMLDVESLSQYLSINTSTDLEKARAIYIWITEHIRYDDDAFNSNEYPNYTADYVLQNRKAVCEGYSNLFLELALEMGIEVDKLSGFSKGYNYNPDNKFTKSNHAWNAVKINGTWRIFDSTWGASYGKTINGKLVSTKQFNEYWFNVDPYEAIFNHYSDDSIYNFIHPSISLPQYEQMPNPTKSYFELGFNGKETFYDYLSNPSLEFPTAYDVPTYIKLLSAPKLKHLERGKPYLFELYIPRGFEVAAINAKKSWTYFRRKKGKFSLLLTPEALGDLSISVRHEESGKAFASILRYHVQG